MEVICEPISNIDTLAKRIRALSGLHNIETKNIIADEDGVGG